MEGSTYVRVCRAAGITLAAHMILALQPGAAAAASPEPWPLPACADVIAPPPRETPSQGAADTVPPWQTVLDGDGVVTEHLLTLRRGGVDVTLRTGRRGFAVPVDDSRMLVGERTATGTRLAMLDTQRACRLWDRELDSLVYGIDAPAGPGPLELGVHDPVTGDFQGQLVLDEDGGATVAMIEGQCNSSCQPNDGELTPAAFLPAGPARQVPAFAAGGWTRDITLPFDWQPGAVPPEWARTPIHEAAADVWSTAVSRSPRFVFRSGASDVMRYTSSFPTFCQYGIACASRNMPSSWSVWLRPHGTDFSWGNLRWCQKEDGAGCFDLRRVMIHELGHIVGLDHPANAGFALEANETVMHAITPAKPQAGSTRHAFGRCDVATLQELYDVPTNSTSISTCNSVATELALSSTAATIRPGQTVRLRAELRVAGQSSFGDLAGNVLNDRAVKLKYRRAGSADAWTTIWMQPQSVGGHYDVTIAPQSSWEFQASFPPPANEGLHVSSSNTVKVRVSK